MRIPEVGEKFTNQDGITWKVVTSESPNGFPMFTLKWVYLNITVKANRLGMNIYKTHDLLEDQYLPIDYVEALMAVKIIKLLGWDKEFRL